MQQCRATDLEGAVHSALENSGAMRVGGGRDLAEGRRGYRRARRQVASAASRRRKVRMVEQVEGLKPKIHAQYK